MKIDIAILKANLSPFRAFGISLLAAWFVLGTATPGLRAAPTELKDTPAPAIQHYNLGADKVALSGHLFVPLHELSCDTEGCRH